MSELRGTQRDPTMAGPTAARGRSRTSAAVGRRGLTLIEMMVAITIVTTAIIALSAFIPRFMNTSSKGAVLSAASDLAVDRVETIKAYPTYATLEATFDSTESAFPTCSTCTRITTIVHDSTATADYKVVTVQVTTPLLADTVSKTTAIPAF